MRWIQVTYLRRYIGLKNGIPSHGMNQGAMGMICPEYLQQLQLKGQIMNPMRYLEEILKKIIFNIGPGKGFMCMSWKICIFPLTNHLFFYIIETMFN